MTDPMTRFQRLQQRYRDGDIPWDHDLPPPEVIAVAAELPPGRMIDLGCGTARACVYLAARGWEADGVDFVPEAIALAEERVRRAGVAHANPSQPGAEMGDVPYHIRSRSNRRRCRW